MTDRHPVLDEDPEQHIGGTVPDPWSSPSAMAEAERPPPGGRPEPPAPGPSDLESQLLAWTVVPCLNELRDQLNAVAPKRDKSSDGSIGDTSHAAGRSSHNPDRTGSPEYADGDSTDEIRARDFDVDLRQPGLTMLRVVRHLVEGARADRFWWLRYIIFQGVIYHRSNKWAARAYTGKNSHHHHAHVNSNFTQAADTVRGVDYGLDEITMPTTDEIADEIMKRLNLKADGRTTAGRTVGGTLDALASTDITENPIAKLQIPDYAQPAATRRKVPLSSWLGYTDHNHKVLATTILNGIAAMDPVDTAELAAALAPAVATAVVAQLPKGTVPLTQEQVIAAVETAFKRAFAS